MEAEALVLVQEEQPEPQVEELQERELQVQVQEPEVEVFPPLQRLGQPPGEALVSASQARIEESVGSMAVSRALTAPSQQQL